MLATFKETVKTLKDRKYGDVIVKKSVGQALWYWTKYLILMMGVVIIIAIAALTYYTPQLPKLATENLPDIEISLKDGKVGTTAPEPFIRGDANFSFILDTKGDPKELDNFKTGVLVLSDRVITKSETETRIIELKDVQDFSGNKELVVSWLKSNQTRLMLVGVVVAIFAVIILGGFFWVWQAIGFAFWSLVMFVASKLMKRPLPYVNVFKIVAYASVLSFLVKLITMFMGGSAQNIIPLGVFLFYTLSWIRNLNTK